MASPATSEVEICNLALAAVGSRNILSLNDDSKRARLCKLHYYRERNRLLRSHFWKFAIKRQSLALSTEKVDGWDYVYQLPSDLIRILYPDVNLHLYRIEQDKLLTNVILSYLRYVQLIENTAKFDECFIDALVCKIAYKLAKPIADNESLKNDLEQEYARAITEARSTDAMEDGPQWIDSEEWLASRYMGTAGPTGWLRDNRRL